VIFSLEALKARHGDSLLLHYGAADEPRLTLIDGGPGGTYGEALKPRLDEVRGRLQQQGRLGADDPLVLDLIMVSHIDDDHIGGLLRLTDALLNAGTPWLRTKTLWHNAFEDLSDEGAVERELPPAEVPTDGADAGAVLVSVKQGRRLRKEAELLGWPVNAPLDSLVRAPDSGGRSVKLDDGTRLRVLAPRDDQIEGLRREWAEQMRKLRAKEASPAEVAAYLDESPYNLSSIVALVEQGDRRMLLTGDARGDQVLGAVDAAGAGHDGKLHVDVLKVPHHGSIRNVELDFFERITAEHYVISGDGKHGNPETETLELIAKARDDDDFTIHLTYAEGADDLGSRLEAFITGQRGGGRGFGFERRADPALSLAIDLGDERVL
jgi:hypothetical protein